MSRLEVYGDRIFLVLDPIKEKVIKGVVIPDKHSERTRVATIVDIGAEVKRYRVGDRVIVSPYTGVRLHLPDMYIDGREIEEETFRVAREEEILGKWVE